METTDAQRAGLRQPRRRDRLEAQDSLLVNILSNLSATAAIQRRAAAFRIVLVQHLPKIHRTRKFCNPSVLRLTKQPACRLTAIKRSCALLASVPRIG